MKRLHGYRNRRELRVALRRHCALGLLAVNRSERWTLPKDKVASSERGFFAASHAAGDKHNLQCQVDSPFKERREAAAPCKVMYTNRSPKWRLYVAGHHTEATSRMQHATPMRSKRHGTARGTSGACCERRGRTSQSSPPTLPLSTQSKSRAL